MTLCSIISGFIYTFVLQNNFVLMCGSEVETDKGMSEEL